MPHPVVKGLVDEKTMDSINAASTSMQKKVSEIFGASGQVDEDTGEPIVYGHVGHWEKCERDRDCELFDDVCCPAKKSYSSKD